ncbi:MAG: hypothetical protein Q7J68_00505, partial [Thermoplasmata archaeon]|nr:hypothetical protein [Thermoplasmata archaeon]
TQIFEHARACFLFTEYFSLQPEPAEKILKKNTPAQKIVKENTAAEKITKKNTRGNLYIHSCDVTASLYWS